MDGNVSAKNVSLITQGSYRSWKVLESPGILLFRIPGPGNSWKKA